MGLCETFRDFEVRAGHPCRFEVDEVQREDPAVHLSPHQRHVEIQLGAAGPSTGHLHHLHRLPRLRPSAPPWSPSASRGTSTSHSTRCSISTCLPRKFHRSSTVPWAKSASAKLAASRQHSCSSLRHQPLDEAVIQGIKALVHVGCFIGLGNQRLQWRFLGPITIAEESLVYEREQRAQDRRTR